MVSLAHTIESDAKNYYANVNGMAFIKAIKNPKNEDEVNLICKIENEPSFENSFALYGIDKKIIPHIYTDIKQMMNFLDEYVLYLESKYRISSSKKLQYVIKGIDAIMHCIILYDCLFFSFENVLQPLLIGNPVYI